MKQTPEQIINSAMALPVEQRAAIITALQETILGDDVDHGLCDSQNEVKEAWAKEIKQRVDDVRKGKIKTIPSAEAWELIDDDSQEV